MSTVPRLQASVESRRDQHHVRMRPRHAACCVLALLACACKQTPSKAGAASELVTRAPATTAVPTLAEAVASSEQLARYLAACDHSHAGKVLGPHRIALATQQSIAEGTVTLTSLDDTTSVQWNGTDDYHATYQNSHDYGREVIAQNGALYLRPRYGKFHVRPPEAPEEASAILDTLVAAPGDYVDLLAPHLAISARDTQHLSRAAKAVTLTPAPRSGAASRGDWRDTISVASLEGDYILDASAPVILRAKLRADLTYNRDGRSFRMKLNLDYDITDVGRPVAITLPPEDQRVTTAEHHREAFDRDTLLRGIAPPPPPPPKPKEAPE